MIPSPKNPALPMGTEEVRQTGQSCTCHTLGLFSSQLHQVLSTVLCDVDRVVLHAQMVWKAADR